MRLNGRAIRELGCQAVWGTDRIEVDGRPVPSPPQALYLMLHKPFGIISALKDPQGRRLVTDLLKDVPGRVYPIGRLDFDSMGLLLLTNDGELAHRLMHPRNQIPRTYKVTVAGAIGEEALYQLKRGLPLEDGRYVSGKATLLTRDPEKSVLRLTIHQGRYRQVRRMLDAVGFEVVHLIRTGFGPLVLGDLKPGAYRYLEPGEVLALRRLVGLA